MTIRGMDTQTAKQPPDGCIKCRRTWPTSTFSQFNEAVARGETPEYICDLCLEFAPDEISAAIDEATKEHTVAETFQREASGISRRVEVWGIESKSNVISFSYLTHKDSKALGFTDLRVQFKGDKWYLYSAVPTAVCEGWLVAPSKGSYFADFIKTSYRCEKL